MEVKELNEALEGIKSQVAKATSENKEALEAQVKALETKVTEAIEAGVKDATDALQAEIKAVQKHADALDVKMQGKSQPKEGYYDNIKSVIKENGDDIQNVKKGNVVDIKAVGDMSTANLTGDEPRSYNFDIVTFPSQKVNVADIVGSMSIDGGTYTYTRETTKEGVIGAQAEGATKNQVDYDFATVDVATDFIAGFARYSRKMRNNLSYITSAIPNLLRRDYFKAENAAFNAILEADATASTEIITNKTKAEMLVNEISKLEDADYDVNGILVRPSDYYDILKTPKDNLAAIVSYEGGVLRINGIQLLKATWLTANKYFVGDWSRVNKVNTEELSLQFSDSEGDNFVKNMITARIESQTALAVEQPEALIFGDFTATV